MKTYLYLGIILLLLSFRSEVNAQQPWAKPGAHWYYAYGDSSAFGVYGYMEATKVGDTMYNNILCDVITLYYDYTELWFPYTHRSVMGPNRYTYISNDTVYVNYDSTFQILFITNPAPGSYWISGTDDLGLCDGDSIFIDSVQIVNINNVTMNRIVPVPFDQFSPFPLTVNFNDPIYERFGSTRYFLPAAACLSDGSEGPLCYYSDSSGFVYSNLTAQLCGAVPTGIATLTKQNLPTITSSITTDKLEINLNSNKSYENVLVEIYDTNGKLIHKYISHENQIGIDVSYYPNGLYICTVRFDQQIYNLKFIKSS